MQAQADGDNASKNDDALVCEEDILYVIDSGVTHGKCEKGDKDKDEHSLGYESDKVEADDDGYYDYSAEEFKSKINSHCTRMIQIYYDLSELLFMAKQKHPDDDDTANFIAEIKDELRGYVDFDACVDINTPFPKDDKGAMNGNMEEEGEKSPVHTNLDQGESANASTDATGTGCGTKVSDVGAADNYFVQPRIYVSKTCVGLFCLVH